MKTITHIIFLCFFCTSTLLAQVTPSKQDTVETVRAFKNIYRYKNYYIGAQPTYEVIQWLKTRGVSAIINLRSPKENQDFAAVSFNEEMVASQMGLKYYSVPVDGNKDYTPARLDEVARIIKDEKAIFIHCAGGGRATYFFMAYLIKYQNYTIDEAIEKGKKLTFSFPLENLLDTKISMEAVD